jgi:ribosomal protein L37AE/L43A
VSQDKEEKPPFCPKCFVRAKKVWMIYTWYWYCQTCKKEVVSLKDSGYGQVGRVSWDDDSGWLD